MSKQKGVRFSVIDGVGNTAECGAIAEQVVELLAARAVGWKHDTHVPSYAPLPLLLADLGILTPDGRVHFTLLPPGCQVALHEHPWPAFVYFPAQHPLAFFHFAGRPVDVVPGRLVLLPAKCGHWVPRNTFDEPRLAIASELSSGSRFL